MNRIIVLGSSNTDMVIHSPRIPMPGETILGGKFFTNPGGKGANQAVAAARLGGKVVFITRIGNDLFGKESLRGFESEGIDLKYVTVDSNTPSGVALITVDEKGENTIVVASGANGTLTSEMLSSNLPSFTSTDILLMQLEIPLPAVFHAAAVGSRSGTRVILNPAPAQPLDDTLLNMVNILTPNETEASLLSGVHVTGLDAAAEAAALLQRRGPKTVIITMGAKGALALDGHELFHVPAPKVNAIDTTAAGDVFNGALAVALGEGKSMRDAVIFACDSSAISVTRFGAQSSAPFRSELLN